MSMAMKRVFVSGGSKDSVVMVGSAAMTAAAAAATANELSESE